MTVKNNLRLLNFCKKYYLNILNDTKRCMKFGPVNCVIHTDELTSIKEIHYDTEPLVTFEIPLSKLEAIADLESLFYNNIEGDSRRHLFENWMDQQSDERHLRNTYKACQTAYDDYNAVLDWCRRNPKQFKDL